MAIKYETVVPWGRSYQEYIDMFNLSDEDLEKNILGCGDGPASFNCTMHKIGKHVVSIDPIYQFSKIQIEHRIQQTYQTVIEQTRQNQENFIWTRIKDVDELGRIRMLAMKDFLEDYETGKMENHYIYAELPELPFSSKQFDLALSSHFLFLYTDNLSFDFHIQAITEMLRVSHEVRIFPLLDVNSVQSSYLEKVIECFLALNFEVKKEKVNYEFQRGGNQMLKIISR